MGFIGEHKSLYKVGDYLAYKAETKPSYFISKVYPFIGEEFYYEAYYVSKNDKGIEVKDLARGFKDISEGVLARHLKVIEMQDEDNQV
jgi:hypothetical protein